MSAFSVPSPVNGEPQNGATRHAATHRAGRLRAELLFAIIDLIERGHAGDAAAMIDQLLRTPVRSQRLVADLRTLRGIAELEIARAERCFQIPTGSPQDPSMSALRTILDFSRNILPSLEMAERAHVHVVLTGGRPTDRVVDLARSGVSPSRQSALSKREFQVLQLVALGLPNQEIADRMSISVGTVKKHLSGVLKKLDAANRTQAVAHGREIGLL